MSLINFFTREQILKMTLSSNLDLPIGKTILIIKDPLNWQTELKNSSAKYIFIGLPEEIGTQVSKLRVSSTGAFQSFLSQFLNFQDNCYLSGEECLVLGAIVFDDLINRSKVLKLTKEEMAKLVKEIDLRVENLVSFILGVNKIPIIIGGGQNNSYPIMRSLQNKLHQSVNCLNISSDVSLRITDLRSARNSFSCGILNGVVNKYFAYGLHENEITNHEHNFILSHNRQINFTRFEQYIGSSNYIEESIMQAVRFLYDTPTGLDINFNCFADVFLSPTIPDGFLLREIRNVVRKFCLAHKDVSYLHICEASTYSNEYYNYQVTGKCISLLVSDFIKSNSTLQSENKKAQKLKVLGSY